VLLFYYSNSRLFFKDVTKKALKIKVVFMEVGEWMKNIGAFNTLKREISYCKRIIHPVWGNADISAGK
jgi:hypothetical protein